MTGKLEGRKEVLLTYAALDQVPHRKLERAMKRSKRKKRKKYRRCKLLQKCKHN